MKRVISLIICVVILFSLNAATYSSALATNQNENYHWVGSWATSPIKTGVMIGKLRLLDFLNNCTYRTVIQMTLGGTHVRLKFSNIYGDSDVVIDETTIARTSTKSEGDIRSGSDIPVTFNGKRVCVIPAGKYVYSDPVEMKVSALEYLSITSYISKFTRITTGGLYGGTSYLEAGKKINNESLSVTGALTFNSNAITYHVVPFLCAADVYCPKDCFSIVFIGDSTITNQSPYYLAERLVKSGVTNIGICQEAIIANKLLTDGEGNSIVGNIYGEAMTKRFERDALATPGVKKIFVKIGLNDVIHPRTNSMKDKVPLKTAEEIIEGYQKLIDLARKENLKIYFFSRTAWKGYSRNFALTSSNKPDVVWSQEADDILNELNIWLQYKADIDGYIDLDFLRDPSDPAKLLADYTTDGAHLSELGARLLADAVPARYLDIADKKIISINDLYLSGKGGEKVTTPYTSNNPTTTKPPAATATETVTTPAAISTSSLTNPMPTGGAQLTTAVQTTVPSGTMPSSIIIVTELNTGEAQTVTHIVTDPTKPTITEPTPEEKMDTGTKVGIVIVALISVLAFSFVTVYFVGKKQLID
ncbi:MAG TPA: hypothetical protein GXZ23_02420 [Clostridiales bacterium]|nr:hypothetical protein [Clostridiales bacterium]